MSPFIEHFGGPVTKGIGFHERCTRRHDGYSRKVSAYTDLETALVTLFPAEQLSSWCVRLTGRWVNRRPNPSLGPPGTPWTITDDGADGLVNGAIQTFTRS